MVTIEHPDQMLLLDLQPILLQLDSQGVFVYLFQESRSQRIADTIDAGDDSLGHLVYLCPTCLGIHDGFDLNICVYLRLSAAELWC